MKKGYTILEVSILLVIFIIVAFLVAPFTVDDTMQAKNISKWIAAQSNFSNIVYHLKNSKVSNKVELEEFFDNMLASEFKEQLKPYGIKYMNGANYPLKFDIYQKTIFNTTIAYKLYEKPQGDKFGLLMYDVNGEKGPNRWGKDIFGDNIYQDKFEPFCKADTKALQTKDCSRGGTGLCCSNYYLLGGNIE